MRHSNYDVVAFGAGAEMATELAELVVAGIKRATAGLARQFGPDGEPPPVVGGYVVLLDEWWLSAHRRFFGRRAAAQGFQIHDEIETVFERFEIVWPPEIADVSQSPEGALGK